MARGIVIYSHKLPFHNNKLIVGRVYYSNQRLHIVSYLGSNVSEAMMS